MILQHGYHLSQWQLFEKGQPITVDSLLRIATSFDMTLTDLLGELGQFPHKQSAATEELQKPAAVAVAKSSEKLIRPKKHIENSR